MGDNGLREVAQTAGVGLATASRALAGRGRVAPATRARVIAAATALGWRPDPALARLGARRQGVANPKGSRVALFHERGSGIPTGLAESLPFLRQAVREAGLLLTEVDLDDHADAPSLLRFLLDQGCVGALVHLLHRAPFALDPIWARFPAVALGAATLRPAIPLAGADDVRRARAVWQLVEVHGWRRIGIALPAWPPSDAQADALGGLLAGREALAGSLSIPVLHYPPEAPTEILPWYAEHRPEAVIVFDPTAGRVVQPLGCSVACLGVFNAEDRGVWAGGVYDWDMVGAGAARLLSTMIRGGIPGSRLADISQLVAMPAIPGRSLRRHSP